MPSYFTKIFDEKKYLLSMGASVFGDSASNWDYLSQPFNSIGATVICIIAEISVPALELRGGV